MKINVIDMSKGFEQTFQDASPETTRVYTLINPHFFNFLRRTFAEDEIVEPVRGVFIIWSSAHRLPRVRIEDFDINEDAQLFAQMYGSQMVEGEI